MSKTIVRDTVTNQSWAFDNTSQGYAEAQTKINELNECGHGAYCDNPFVSGYGGSDSGLGSSAVMNHRYDNQNY